MLRVSACSGVHVGPLIGAAGLRHGHCHGGMGTATIRLLESVPLPLMCPWGVLWPQCSAFPPRGGGGSGLARRSAPRRQPHSFGLREDSGDLWSFSPGLLRRALTLGCGRHLPALSPAGVAAAFICIIVEDYPTCGGVQLWRWVLVVPLVPRLFSGSLGDLLTSLHSRDVRTVVVRLRVGKPP